VAVARSIPGTTCVKRSEAVASKEPMLPGKKVSKPIMVDTLQTAVITKKSMSTPMEKKESFIIKNFIPNLFNF